MPAKQLKKYLDEEHVKYTTITHSQAFTAQEIAHAAHISGHNVAKTVIAKVDDRMAMLVLPASDQVVFDLFKEAIGARRVELATEREFQDLFPECELGAMPPFGNLFGMDVYVAEGLTHDEDIAFNAGSHTELVRMAYRDFQRLVQPRIVRLSYSDTAAI